MKFLAFSDIHACNYKSFAKYTNGRNSRLTNVLSSVESIQLEGKKLGVDFYLFAGDLFHTQGYVENDVFNLTFDVFKKFDKPVICIPGNHDNFHSNNSKDISFLKFTEIPNITILSDSHIKSICGITICCFGYNNDVNTEDITKNILNTDAKENRKVVLIHQTPKGCKLNDYIFDEGINYKEVEKVADLVLFGHIHQPQKLTEKSIVIGSPLQANFSDRGDRGFWFFDDNFKSSFYPIDLPKFITADRITDDIKRDKKNYYRILHLDIIENDNIVGVKQKKEAISDRNVVNSEMTSEAIVDRYIAFQQIEEKLVTCYRQYGLTILQKADSVFQPIVPSNYKLEKISIEGFLSFKDKVELKIEKGVWLVLGECDVFTSNGAGKSSLFDSVFWCLYNQTTKGISSNNVINDELESNCRVTLEMIDDKNKSKLIIDRFRKYNKIGTGLNIIQNDKEIEGTPTILEEKLVNILGFDYDFFLNTVYYSQEKTEFFASSTDSVKKSFLDSILQTSKYDIALKECRNNLNTNDNETKSCISLIDTLLRQVSVIEESIKILKEKAVKFEADRSEKLKGKEQELCDISLLVNDVDYKIKNKKEKLKSDSIDLIAVTSSQNIINVGYLNKKNDVRMILSSLQQDTKRYNNDIESNNQKIFRIQNLKEECVCDTCGNIITSFSKQKLLDQITIITDGLTDKIKKNEAKLVILQEELDIVESDYKIKIATFLTKKSVLEKSISLLENEIDNLEGKYNQFIIQKNILDKVIDRCKNDVNTFDTEINVISNSITAKQGEIEKTKSKVDILQSYKKILTFWETAFSNKGIKSLLFDEFCRLFNNEIGNSLSLLSGNSMSVSLSNQTRLASGELSEKMSIKVILFGKEKDYVNLSGGEKRRVDIAVMVTLNKIIRMMYNISSGLLGMLILDEIFSSLDNSGEENVYELLEELSHSINSIYVITHTEELKSYFNNYITVKKKNRCSSIENIIV